MLTQKQLTRLIILAASLFSLLIFSTVTVALDNEYSDNLNSPSGMLLANNNKNKGHTAQHQTRSAPSRPHNQNQNRRLSRAPTNNRPHVTNKYHNPSVKTYRQVRTKNTLHNNKKSANKRYPVNKSNAIKSNTIKSNAIKKNSVNQPSLINQHGIKPVLHFGTAVTGASIANSAENINPPHVIKNNRPSHLSNKFTQANIKKSKALNQKFFHNANNSKWRKNINGYQKKYKMNHHNKNIQAFKGFNHFWHNHHYHNWYSHWYRWGFYGGFWYPVRPDFDIDNYFYYPLVQWFYVDEPITQEYYTNYYPSEAAPSSACLTSFPYTNIYFPTDTLRDLLVEVSGFPQNLLCNFRTAIIKFTAQMQQIVSSNFSMNFSFQQNNIVLNYYQNLQNKAIVIAGFVSQNNINLAFEGFLDLENPDQTIAFAPKGQNPTADELQVLDQLNNRIKSLGGDPFTAQQEPDQGQVQTQQPSEGVTQENTSAPGP